MANMQAWQGKKAARETVQERHTVGNLREADILGKLRGRVVGESV